MLFYVLERRCVVLCVREQVFCFMCWRAGVLFYVLESRCVVPCVREQVCCLMCWRAGVLFCVWLLVAMSKDAIS